MKKKIICVLTTVLFLTLLFNISVSSHLQNSNDSADIGWYTSLDLDESDHPYISYYDYDHGDLKYAYYTGSFWKRQTVDTEGDVGRYTSIAIDSNKKAHISYYDHDHGDLKYAYYTGNSWEISRIDEEGKTGLFTCITLDNDDQPHISYVDYDNHYLKYATLDNTEWKIETVDKQVGLGEYFSDTTSIKIDTSNTPHISYCDREHFDLKYAYFDGESWVNKSIDEIGDVGQYSSLTLDKKDNPHISYASWSDFNLKYAYVSEGEWKVETIDDTGDVRKWTSIDLDYQDKPHISYYDYTLGSLQYIFFTGTNWQRESIDTQGSTGCFNSISLNSNDDPMISYYDWGNKALKFAEETRESWSSEIIERDAFHDYIDQQQIYCSGYSYPIAEEEPVAQSFFPSAEVLTMVDLMIVKRNNPGAFTVSIRENINGADLTTVSLNSNEIAEDLSWKTIDIPDINVTAAQLYYLVCSSEHTAGNNMYYWYFGHNEPYQDGKPWLYTGEWELFNSPDFPDADMGFKTYGRINDLPNQAPNTPTINGPHTGKVNTKCHFEIYATDVNNDLLYYEIQWCEDEHESIGPSPSGEIVSINHTWSAQGDYTIQVKAVDEHGAESEWSSFQMSMPKIKETEHSFFIMRYFQIYHPWILLKNIAKKIWRK